MADIEIEKGNWTVNTEHSSFDHPGWLIDFKEICDKDPDVWDRHKNEPHVSFEAYKRRCYLSHGEQVRKKIRIYLDLRYWIYCRDAFLGKPQKPVHNSIWMRLSDLVESGLVVCPISYPVVSEIFKQRDLVRRGAIAEVADRLSGNVAIRPPHELWPTEVHHFLLSKLPSKEVYPLDQLAWTFPTWWLGEAMPHFPELDEATNCLMKKAYFDSIKECPLSITIKALSASSWPKPADTNEYYDNVNAQCRAHRHEITDFHSAFMTEIAGLLDCMEAEIEEISKAMYESEYGHPPPPSECTNEDGHHLFTRLIYNAFRLKRITTEIPYLHINAGIHGALRHRRQPFKNGDYWDHLHAYPAIAYCQAFFVETSLGHLVSNRPLELNHAYGCSVLWNEDEVLKYLMSIGK